MKIKQKQFTITSYILLISFFALTQDAHAVLTTYDSSISSGNVWQRPQDSTITYQQVSTNTSNWTVASGNKTYNAYQFTVTNAGDYTIMIDADFDVFGILYQGSFDPCSPLDNGVALNDDGGGTVAGAAAGLGANDVYMPDLGLTADEYILVTTSFASDTGDFTTSIIGPYAVIPVGDVTGGTLHVEIALQGNQMDLAVALDDLAGSSGDMGTLLSEINGLSSNAAKQDAYNQLCGQNKLAVVPVANQSTTKFMSTAGSRMRSASAGSRSYSNVYFAAADTSDNTATMTDAESSNNMFAVGNNTEYYSDSSYGFWGKGFGVFGDRETEGTVTGYKYQTYGTAFGLDRAFSDEIIAGITFGYSNSNIDYASVRDENRIDSLYLGIYGSYDTPLWYFDSILTYTDLEFETDRYVSFGGINQHLEAEYDGYEIAGYFEAGLNKFYKDIMVKPLAAFEFGYLKQDGYSESGGSSALKYKSESNNSYKGSLGVKLSKYLQKKEEAYLLGEIRGRWIHEFGDAHSGASASFTSNPGNVFSIEDEKMAIDSAALGAGLKAGIENNTELFADFDVLLNTDNVAYIISAGFEYRF